MQRPDLSNVDPEILVYIEYLEGEINRNHAQSPRQKVEQTTPEPVDERPVFEPAEPPTTINLITVTRQGIAKRTARHLYHRQRRSGMGIFDLETSGQQTPDFLLLADESQTLILFTNFARAFRFPLSRLNESAIRARGDSLLERLPLEPDETIAAILPDQATGYISMVSKRGMVRTLRHHLFGEYLKPGTSFFNFRDFGPMASACWTPGDAELFIATRNGLGIRFAEKGVPPQGIQGMKVDPADEVVSVTSVRDDSGVFLVGADGRGTVRKMSGFNPNKSPGGSGKIALKTDRLVGAVSVDPSDDLFLISGLGKLIRFSAGEVPETEGVIQGVVCMGLRGDEVCALAISSTITSINYR